MHLNGHIFHLLLRWFCFDVAYGVLLRKGNIIMISIYSLFKIFIILICFRDLREKTSIEATSGKVIEEKTSLCKSSQLVNTGPHFCNNHCGTQWLGHLLCRWYVWVLPWFGKTYNL